MSKVLLGIPEDYAGEVIKIIRAGLRSDEEVSDTTREQLAKWCDDTQEYITMLESGESEG